MLKTHYFIILFTHFIIYALETSKSIASVLKILCNGVYYGTSLPTPCSLRSCWQLEISHRRSINPVKLANPNQDLIYCFVNCLDLRK